ncbi:MAG TPA: hypothetical protein VK701_04815 [Solirubrobacteraceae bacterium]|jgi:hypothetical protein|nr:hypothetical protein [Solirubrobacteraceae bacterium]
MKSFSGVGRGALSLAIVVVAALSTSATIQAPASASDPGASAARTIDGTDTAHLHLIHQDESLLYEEGSASGSLPGRMRAKLTIGSLFRGSCTIYTADGSIVGQGSATPHGSGRYQSFSGALLITSGSGRYDHIHGRTRLYGTFDRRTFSLIVQTTGRLSY